MSTDPRAAHADPADVNEQQKDLVPSVEDEEAPDSDPDEVPLEADEADVTEQRIEVPDLVDDDVGET
jgi:hypothetical protein